MAGNRFYQKGQPRLALPSALTLPTVLSGDQEGWLGRGRPARVDATLCRACASVTP